MLVATGLLLAAMVRAAAPDAAVRATWSDVDAAWNARDVDRFSGLFTTDVSFEIVDRGEVEPGQVFGSRDELHASFAARFPRFAPELRHRTIVRDVRPLTDDLAAVDGTVEILRVGSDGETTAVVKRLAIFAVMARPERRWSVALLRAYELPLAAAASQPRAELFTRWKRLKAKVVPVKASDWSFATGTGSTPPDPAPCARPHTSG